jgi:hypothetical protein
MRKLFVLAALLCSPVFGYQTVVNPTTGKLDFVGVSNSTTAVSSTISVKSTHVYIGANAGSGALVFTLHSSSQSNRQPLLIKKTDVSANSVTINALAGEAIDGSTGTLILNGQGSYAYLYPDGTGWQTLGFTPTPAFLGFKDGPSAAQAVSASSATQCVDIYTDVPARVSGMGFVVGNQSGSMQVSVADQYGVVLASSTEQVVPASGARQIVFSTAVNVARGRYKLCLGADNTSATFTKSSGNGAIGCNNYTSTMPAPAAFTLPGSATVNCFSIVGVVTGGIPQ